MSAHCVPGQAALTVPRQARTAGDHRERSMKDRETFARDKDTPHPEAWRLFNKTIRSAGSVGIFQETYLVDAGKYEALFGHMPVFGLAAAIKPVPAIGRRETARRRLGG